ncbi:MAG TPA: hypothetical protein VGQ19_12695 [Burkholderiales bacterium]|nr:hypothetical protein [Burkholderiales bacterium]
MTIRAQSVGRMVLIVRELERPVALKIGNSRDVLRPAEAHLDAVGVGPRPIGNHRVS